MGYREDFFKTNKSKNGKYECAYCGEPLNKDQVDVDHVIPKSRGGSNSVSDAITVLKMLEQLEKSSGGDVSQWKKLADELRQSIRDTAAEAAKSLTEKTDTSDISYIVSAAGANAAKTGEEKEAYTADPEVIRQIAEEISEQTDAFAAKYCVTDREQMRAMLDTVRHGGSVAGGSDNTFGGNRERDWYIKGYVPAVYM